MSNPHEYGKQSGITRTSSIVLPVDLEESPNGVPSGLPSTKPEAVEETVKLMEAYDKVALLKLKDQLDEHVTETEEENAPIEE